MPMQQPTHLDDGALRRLLDVGADVVADLDLESVLRRVLDAARELTGARYAALGVLDAQRGGLERFLTSGIDEADRRVIGDLPQGRGVLGLLITDPRPLRLENVGSHPESYGFPIGHPPMSSFLGVPILIAGQAFGNLYLTEKAGGPFGEADEEAIVVLARWTASAIANARLYEAERAGRAALEHSVRSLRTTTEIARALGAETDLTRVLELIVKRGRALVEAHAMAILLVDGDELVVTAAAGAIDASVVGARLQLAETVSGDALTRGRTESVPDMSRRMRFGLRNYVDATAGLFVPMRFRDRSVGVLNAFDRLVDGPGFTPADAELLEAFAAAAATAVSMAQDVAAQTLRRSIDASESERTRWARELHDETLQDLGALRLALGAAARLEDLGDVRAAIAEARAQVGDSITGLRHLITELRPAALNELGVEAALEALVDRVGTVNDLEIELHVDLGSGRANGSGRLSDAVETTLYRTVQEALTNVVKHAGATTVRIEVTEHDAVVSTTVTDDGRGFDTAALASGFGLLGMRERVGLVSGSLELHSAAGQGTTLRVTLPTERAVQTALRFG